MPEGIQKTFAGGNLSVEKNRKTGNNGQDAGQNPADGPLFFLLLYKIL